MNTVASTEPRIQHVQVTEDEIIARLADGRVISVPLAWSWRLSEATPQQRAHFRLIGSGQGVHWPDIDEDISVEGMLHGVPAHRPKSKAASERGGVGGGFLVDDKADVAAAAGSIIDGRADDLIDQGFCDVDQQGVPAGGNQTDVWIFLLRLVCGCCQDVAFKVIDADKRYL